MVLSVAVRTEREMASKTAKQSCFCACLSIECQWTTTTHLNARYVQRWKWETNKIMRGHTFPRCISDEQHRTCCTLLLHSHITQPQFHHIDQYSTRLLLCVAFEIEKKTMIRHKNGPQNRLSNGNPHKYTRTAIIPICARSCCGCTFRMFQSNHFSFYGTALHSMRNGFKCWPTWTKTVLNRRNQTGICLIRFCRSSGTHFNQSFWFTNSVPELLLCIFCSSMCRSVPKPKTSIEMMH